MLDMGVVHSPHEIISPVFDFPYQKSAVGKSLKN